MALTTTLPLLSEQENNELLRKAKSGDNAAKELYFAHNYRLMVYVAGQFKNTGLMLDDLIGVTQIGFLKAYNSFDFSKDAKFATYAVRCMRNEVLMCIRKSRKWRSDVSFDAPIATDADGREFLLSEILPDRSDDEEQTRRQELEFLVGLLKDTKLSERERQIIQLYYYEDLSMRQVGLTVGLSQAYISRVHKQIIHRLQKTMKKQGGVLFTAKTQPQKGVVIPMNRDINKGHMVFLLKYGGLTNGHISAIMGASMPTVANYRTKWENGKLHTPADDSIKSELEAYLSGIPPENRRRIEHRRNTAPSPVKSHILPKLERPASTPPLLDPADMKRPDDLAFATVVADMLFSPALGRPVTTEDELLTKQAETPPPERRQSITLTLDKADPATIKEFLAVLYQQMEEGSTYRFHVNMQKT